jgi:hypothetical protein
MMRKSLMVGLSLAALMFAAPVYAQTDTNSGTMKPSATDQDKMTPAPGAQGTTGSAAPRQPAREPAGAGGAAGSRPGSGVTDTDSGTKKQDDTDPKPGTQR